MRTVRVLAPILLMALPGLGQTPPAPGSAAPSPTAPPPDAVAREMAPVWSELVELVGKRPWSALQWTRGIYLATQIFRYGAGGVPFMNGQFSRSGDATVAFLSGVYVTTYGGDSDLTHIRTDLEKDDRKRAWLKGAFGDAPALSASMELGEEWRPALRCLPATAGGRKLATACTRSEDALVRRAGLYWGFWVADGAYWTTVHQALKRDPDPLNRRFAAFLLRKGED